MSPNMSIIYAGLDVAKLTLQLHDEVERLLAASGAPEERRDSVEPRA